MVDTCPTCGAIIPKELTFPTSKIKQAILDFVSRRPGCTREEIMSYVYNDGSGGPETFNVISVHLVKMNKVLAEQGLCIKASMGRGSTYRLMEKSLDHK